MTYGIVYERQKLYEEVWQEPITKIAHKYGVSDVAIHKICRKMNIPKPPAGYWAKVRAGSRNLPKKLPLPKHCECKVIYGNIDYHLNIKPTEDLPKKIPLSFLTTEEKEKILDACKNITLKPEGMRLHKSVYLHKQTVLEWEKNNKVDTKRDIKYLYNYYHKDPVIGAGTLSKECQNRFFRILDALVNTLEFLECEVLPDLTFKIRDEEIKFIKKIHEAQSKVPHEITKDEQYRINQAEEHRKKYGEDSYWSRPPGDIRKYDYVFNGRLTIALADGSHLYDKPGKLIEERLDDIVIRLIEYSEVVKQNRIEREIKEKAEAEERERIRILKEKIKIEKEKLADLKDKAKDWKTACMIRDYVYAVENNINKFDNPNEIKEWIKWAYAKADWYDPILRKKDELFGTRKALLDFSKDE